MKGVFLIVLISFLSLFVFASGCKKDGNDEEVAYPSISSFTPSQGGTGTLVTIYGLNFSSTGSSNIVVMNGIDIEPLSSTSTRIEFLIPSGIQPGEYRIMVKAANLSVQSSGTFRITGDNQAVTDPAVLAYNYVIGTQTIGPSYGFASEDRLVESARKIYEMGSNILKITLSPGSYGITGRSYQNITSLVRDDPSFSSVLDMPFNYYFFWARSHSNWADGYSEAERAEDSVQVGDLARYLLTKYNNTGKSFYIGHWEGDWYLLPNYDVGYVPSDTRINGMIKWFRTRQNAVDEAKRVTSSSNVNVYTYCEVNRVVDAMNGLKRVVNYVLPYTNVDYVSYSSYDAQGMNQAEYNAVMNYIESNLPLRPEIKGKRVFIGEMGRCAQDFGFSASQHESVNRENIRKALAWGAPFILYWEMYNNEIKDGVHRGFWLIDNANVKWPLYNTYSAHFSNARVWVDDFRKKQGRLPTSREYLDWSYMKLANPY